MLVTCRIADCGGDVLNVKRQLCQRHYTRFIRHGDPLIVITPKPTISEDGTRRQCAKCEQWLPLGAFYRDRGAGKGKHSRCKECLRTDGREKWRDRPEQMQRNRRRYILKIQYGITLEEYEAMLTAQQGVCALCGAPPPDDRGLAVDHCHDTKRIRGLLCGPCNTALPRVEIPGWTEAALAYLAAV